MSTVMESLDLWTKNEGSKAIVQYRRRAPALCLRLRPQWDYCQGGESERDSNGPVELGRGNKFERRFTGCRSARERQNE